LEESFSGREIRRIVLLRDPLELQISFYNWQMMDNLAKGLGTYSFDWHLCALHRDFTAHFLLSRWLEIPRPRLMAMTDAQKYEILNRMFADFWFVGAHTDCDRVIEAIAPELGVPPVAPRRNISAEQQGRTGWPLLTAEALPPATRTAFRARNQLDEALWEDWHAAGFEAAGVRPRVLQPGGDSGFLGHEMVRPWYALGRIALHRWATWRRPGGGPQASRADRARDAGEWELAAEYYSEALQAMPGAFAIWVQYGHALKESGRVGAAERAYRLSLSLSPDTADTHLQLGHVLKLLGRMDEAAAAYLRSAALDPALRHPRDELIGLGWTRERIERAVRASASATSGVPLSERWPGDSNPSAEESGPVGPYPAPSGQFPKERGRLR
jgi:tetratricopeptide (TPR) repeat protein